MASTLARTQRDIDNDVELHRHGQEALALTYTGQPKNTLKSYGPAQKEFEDWCKERGFADGTLVHENKLIMFLRLQVLDRELRTSRYKRARTMKDGTTVKQTLGRSAIKVYVNAIISLWEYQSSAGQNLHSHPRGTKLKALLKNKERQEIVRRREQFVDRGVGTMLDGYNEKDMMNIVRVCWTEFSS